MYIISYVPYNYDNIKSIVKKNVVFESLISVKFLRAREYYVACSNSLNIHLEIKSFSYYAKTLKTYYMLLLESSLVNFVLYLLIFCTIVNCVLSRNIKYIFYVRLYHADEMLNK